MTDVLVFDSGLGGTTVLRTIHQDMPAARLAYLADTALFPYGDLEEAELVGRVGSLVDATIAEHDPRVIVIACNTASTLVLPPLRERFPDVPIVGTVPAIKPLAALTKSHLVSVLATPGTVKRDYTQALIATYASHVEVTLVAAERLAALAEQFIITGDVDHEAVRAEIMPAFVERGGRRTDAIALGCTHYPLLLPVLEAIAPWPVRFVDPAPAIARRVRSVFPGEPASGPGSGRLAVMATAEAERIGLAVERVLAVSVSPSVTDIRHSALSAASE